jgi:hypothetical protein
VLLNPAVLVVSGLSDVLGAIGQILLSYLVHMHSRLRSLGQEQVHVGSITWRFCVAEPPKLLGPHAHVLVSKTSDCYAYAPDNLTGSVRLPQGHQINHLQPEPRD